MKALIIAVLSLMVFSQCKTPETSSDTRGLVGGNKKDSPWSKWPPEKGKVAKLKELAETRSNLFKNHLFDRHGKLPNVACTNRMKFARSIDGRCNDLSQPGMGMAGIVFGRNSDPEKWVKPAINRYNVMEPDPTIVADRLLKRTKETNATTLNLFAAAWIQFMTRDWFIRTPDFNVRKNKPYSFRDGLTIPKSKLHPRSKEVGHPVTANEATHWWDLSQIYGSDSKINKDIRTGVNGQMKLGKDGVLPSFSYANVSAPDSSADLNQEISAVPYGGWWSGMSVMYHLFIKEHNYIAAEIAKRNPSWSDQKIFDVARLVNAALMAKIHTIEWTPAILPNEVSKMVLFGNWYGVLSKRDKGNKPGGVRKWFINKMKKWLPQGSASAANIKGAASGILSLGKAQHFNVPFSFTEEFTAVYRLHSLLPDQMTIWDPNTKRAERKVPLSDTLQSGSLRLINELGQNDRAKGLEKLMYSFGKSLPGALIPNNYPNFLRNLPIAKLMPPEVKVPGRGTLDMAVVDIMRDRERGIPRYNNFRRAVGMKPLKTWNDFIDPKADAATQAKQRDTVKTMQEIYKGDLEAVDFVVGCLAEGVRPPGFIFGETQYQIFIAMASRRLFSDRFYTEDYRPEVYTQFGLDHVEDTNFYHMVVRHFPNLAKNMGEEHKENAFLPWN